MEWKTSIAQSEVKLRRVSVGVKSSLQRWMSVTIEGVGFQPKEGLVDSSNKFIHNYPIVIRTTLSMVYNRTE